MNNENQALLFFGESPAEQAYKLPEALSEAKVQLHAPDGKPTDVPLKKVEEDAFIGKRSVKPVDPRATLSTSLTYGNYHGSLLKYYSYHYGTVASVPPKWDAAKESTATQATAKPQAAKTQASGLVVIPSASERGLCLTILWEGKPLEGVEAAVMIGDAEPETAKSDRDGEVWLPPVSAESSPAGPIAAIVGYTLEKAGVDDSETGDGKPYKNQSHYATVTFDVPKMNGAQLNKPETTTASDKTSSLLPPLSTPVASFGGAVAGEFLYVDSGHIGEEHAHSKENLSQNFQRLNLNSGTEWESLPTQQPLQGFPLVSHGEKLYRVGGLNATNAKGEAEELHSVSGFACFDLATKTWKSLAPLPAPRSSHDAVVIGDTLYVVGGWQLTGDKDGAWQEDVLAFDLTRPDSTWHVVTQAPFKRRALAASHLNGKLVALGGMTAERDISCSVDAYDPASDSWTKLPEFPGKEDSMDGFGISAWNAGGKIYASSFGGVVNALAADAAEWQPVAELKTPRFFHRILPGPEQTLLIVGGASAEGHLADVEVVTIDDASRK